MKTAIGAKAATESIETEGPVQISWDQTRRRIVAKINITGRETDSVVADVQCVVPLARPGRYGGFSV